MYVFARCVTVLLVFPITSVACAGSLFVSGDVDRIYRIDTETRAVSFVRSTGIALEDIAFAPDGTLMGIDRESVYAIDITNITRPVKLLGVHGVYNDGPFFNHRELTSLTFGPDGKLYFATYNGLAFSGGVFTPPTGWLGVLRRDPLATIIIGDIGFGNGGGLAFSPDGTLYMNECTPTGLYLSCSTTHDNALVRVDPPLGQGVELGTMGYANVLGMEFVDSVLFGVTNSGQLLEISTATGQATLIENLNPVIRATGASTPVTFPFGDFDGDGELGAGDYDTWRMHYGTETDRPGAGPDGNGDGFVTAADYTVWRDRLNAGVNRSSSIPEPSTIVVLFVFTFLPLRLRRRGFLF